MNIKELAEQAGIDEYEFGYMDITKAELDKFAELVAAHEREECAKLAVQIGQYQNQHGIADAIRARNKT